jgi:hypothetical protein
MNTYLMFILLAMSMSFVTAKEKSPWMIRFSNNDKISGFLESITNDLLVWKSPALAANTSFFLKSVLDLKIAADEPESTANHEASITLTNDDIIRGQLASVAEGSVELDTWFAGRIKFNRLMIRDVRVSERANFIYHGPTGIGDWEQSGEKPAWSYLNSSFQSNAAGSIARNVNLPDESSIAFDAAWDDSFILKLNFFSGDLTSDRPSTGYEMAIQNRSINLRNCKSNKVIGHTLNAGTLQENKKAHIEIRASLRSGKICLFVDRQIIDVWTDPDVTLTDINRCIHFTSQNESPLEISRIEVSAWDGDVGELPDPQLHGGMPQFGNLGDDEAEGMDDETDASSPDKKPNTERMELRNGDSIEGQVISIVDGVINVKTPFREVKLPIEAVRSVALKPVELERCKRENGDVRAWFPDGSSMVFRLDRLAGNKISGTSQNFGKAEFEITAFSRIEFNIYDPNLQEIRAAKW